MTIAAFLLQLAEDPKLYAEFREDPKALAERHGLTREQAGLLLSGDLRDVRVTVDFELEVHGEHIAMRTICGTPQPPPLPPPPSPHPPGQ